MAELDPASQGHSTPEDVDHAVDQPVARSAARASTHVRFSAPSSVDKGTLGLGSSTTSHNAEAKPRPPTLQELSEEAARAQRAGISLYFLILTYVLAINIPFCVVILCVANPRYAVAGSVNGCRSFVTLSVPCY